MAQGSVCGPTMVLIFVNDLVNLCLNSSTLLFADDTVIYLHGENTNELLTKVQEDLNQIEKWCTFNKLSLNVKKNKAMFFGNSFRRDSNPQFTLTLNVARWMIMNILVSSLIHTSILTSTCQTSKEMLERNSICFH